MPALRSLLAHLTQQWWAFKGYKCQNGIKQPSLTSCDVQDMTVDEKSHSLFKVLSQMCLQAKQVQGYKQTYKVLKSNKRVCSVLSLQGEEAVSNVIKLALIFENGSSCSLSLVMGCVFELGI